MIKQATRCFLLAYIVAGFSSGQAFASGALYTEVDLNFFVTTWNTSIESLSRAEYMFADPGEPQPTITGVHSVSNAATQSGSGVGLWEDFLSVGGAPGQCVRGSVTAVESNNGTLQGATTAEGCCPYPQCTIHPCFRVSNDGATNENPGTVQPGAAYTGDCGSTIAMTAHANAGFEFDHWEGIIDSTEPQISVPLVDGGSECAYFNALVPSSYHYLYIATVVDGAQMTHITVKYQAGDELEYSPITPPSFTFSGWTGLVNSSQETIHFTMPNRDAELYANFATSGGGGGGNAGGDDGGTNNEEMPCFPGIDVNCYGSPVVVNFGRGGYQLSGANAPVLFDISGSGQRRPLGWMAQGADEAFLWLDRDHNGKVTDGTELFGNFTRLRSAALAKNGFEALAELDSNRDGVIDSNDSAWQQLMLWRDVNHDGISDPDEMTPLKGSRVVAIRLDYHWSGRRDPFGNQFRYEARVLLEGPDDHVVREAPVYDLFFVPLPYFR